MPTSYENLTARFREVAILSSADALLGWDQEVNLGEAGILWRAEQLAWFQGRVHSLKTSDEVGGWIADCESELDPSSAEGANVRELRRDYDREVKIPGKLVEEMARTRSLALKAWEQAREAADFAPFAPHLEKMVDLAKREAGHLGYEASPYDALIDKYEPGVTAAELKTLFDELEPAVVEVLQETASKKYGKLPAGPYPIESQKAFNREVAAAVGFDFEAGRIDTATHPFCSGMAPGDTRLTTRYDEADFRSSLYGVLHEAGHGLYEQGIPKSEQIGFPLGEAVSLGIHESQSRLWENHVGRSRAFWEHWLATAQKYFPQLGELDAEAMTALVNRARRSYIRVEADEVTYDLHILLRFDLERRLIEGELRVADVPEAWNARFEELFSMGVKNPAKGCLQDIHWSMGLMGYFPTYTLGNLNAAQLMASARESLGDLDGQFSRGEYGTLLEWMGDKVHRHGRRYTPDQLMEKATGTKTVAEHHVTHLRERYV